jgi:hypothetical protein
MLKLLLACPNLNRVLMRSSRAVVSGPGIRGGGNAGDGGHGGGGAGCGGNGGGGGIVGWGDGEEGGGSFGIGGGRGGNRGDRLAA